MYHKTMFGAVLLVSGTTFAGSGPAFVDCKSGTGRTIVHVENQDLHGLSVIKVTIDGKSLTYRVEESDGRRIPGARGEGFFKLADQIITVYAEKSDDNSFGWVEFWGVPGSFRKIRDTDAATEYTFNAKIQGTDPRINPENSMGDNEIAVTCRLKYEI